LEREKKSLASDFSKVGGHSYSGAGGGASKWVRGRTHQFVPNHNTLVGSRRRLWASEIFSDLALGMLRRGTEGRASARALVILKKHGEPIIV